MDKSKQVANHPATKPDEWLDVERVAQELGITPATVRTLGHTGEIAMINVGISTSRKKPRLRISRKSLQAFIDARTLTPPVKSVKRRTMKKSGSQVRFY